MEELRFLIRQLFYYRIDLLGHTVADIVSEKDFDLWKRCWLGMEEPPAKDKEGQAIAQQTQAGALSCDTCPIGRALNRDD